MATAQDFNTYLDQAASHIAAGDYAAAQTQVTLARTVLPQLPRFASDGTSVDYQSANEAIKALEKEIRANGSGGVIFQSVEF